MNTVDALCGDVDADILHCWALISTMRFKKRRKMYFWRRNLNPSQEIKIFRKRSSDYKLQNSINLRVLKVEWITIVFLQRLQGLAALSNANPPLSEMSRLTMKFPFAEDSS